MTYHLKSLTIVSLCCLLLPILAMAEPLHLAYPEFKPFFYRNASGDMEGIFYEIVTEALRREDVSVVWEAYPWPRCQAYVQSGQQDAMITVPTAERAAYTKTHAQPFYNKTLNIFTYAGHPRMKTILGIRRIEDIKTAGLSVITYTTNGWNKDNVESLGVRVVETPTLESIWLMLARRRGDLVIEWPQGAWPAIRAENLDREIVQTDIVLASMPFHLLIRLSSPLVSVLADFDNTIEQMRQDGTMQRILIKYE